MIHLIFALLAFTSLGLSSQEVAMPGAINAAYFDIQSNSIFSTTDEGSIYKLENGSVSVFFKGLSQPKGMRSYMGRLWVAAKDRAVSIDIRTAQVISELKLSATANIVDVALDNTGAVYTADIQNNVIWKNSQEYKTFKSASPSAVLIIINDLFILTNQFLVKINLSTKKEEVLFRWQRKTSGGLELAANGDFILGDIEHEALLYVTKDGKIVSKKPTPNLTGDFGYQYFKESKQDQLLLPIKNESKIKFSEVL